MPRRSRPEKKPVRALVQLRDASSQPMPLTLKAYPDHPAVPAGDRKEDTARLLR